MIKHGSLFIWFSMLLIYDREKCRYQHLFIAWNLGAVVVQFNFLIFKLAKFFPIMMFIFHSNNAQKRTSKRDDFVWCQVSNSEHNFDHNLESERWKTKIEDIGVKMNFLESVLIRLGLPLFKGKSQHSWGLAVTEDGDHQSCCMPIQKGLSFVVLIDCILWRTLKKIRC